MNTPSRLEQLHLHEQELRHRVRHLMGTAAQSIAHDCVDAILAGCGEDDADDEQAALRAVDEASDQYLSKVATNLRKLMAQHRKVVAEIRHSMPNC